MLNSGKTSAKTLVLVHLLSRSVDLVGSMEPIISSVYVTFDAFDFIGSEIMISVGEASEFMG